MSSPTKDLVQSLYLSQNTFRPSNPENEFNLTFRNSKSTRNKSFTHTSRPSSKISLEKQEARQKYQDLTNLSKQQKVSMIWKTMMKNKKNEKKWSYQYYTGNNKNTGNEKTFSRYQQSELDPYPHSNKKYNTQFLDRTLKGGSMKICHANIGQFKKPSYSLYSKHYRPIVKEKIDFNEDWQLRSSLFGKTWVDQKKNRILDQYKIHAKPFKTPKSNELLAKVGQK